jgi:RimJ/RimL family protein N-acetyltransferase
MAFPDSIPRIVTERLVLRALDGRDRTALFSIFSDPGAMRYWSSSPFTDIAQAQRIIDEARALFEQRTALRWGIALRDDQRIVGTCVLFDWNEQNLRAELGYILGRDHWRRGFMREALAALIEYAFRTAGLHRLEADIDPRNAASIRSLEHFGFAREGLLRERWRVAGETQDSLMMGLLRSEWEAWVAGW